MHYIIITNTCRSVLTEYNGCLLSSKLLSQPSISASSCGVITKFLAGRPRDSSASSGCMHALISSNVADSTNKHSLLSLDQTEDSFASRFHTASVFFSKQLKNNNKYFVVSNFHQAEARISKLIQQTVYKLKTF